MRFEVTRPGAGPDRCGTLTLGEKQIQTPVFMPCASLAVVRACPSHLVAEQGIQMMIANAYHLWQRPGTDLVTRFGGIHDFMAWPGAMATDSGGYQVFSLAEQKNITENGVTFRSHIDGSLLELTPEKAMQIQNELGADIAMVLDECVALPAEREYVEESVEMTARWAARCAEAHDRPDQALFGIVQGGTCADLRVRSSQKTVEIGFDGYAIGGLSVGESRSEMLQAVEACLPHLPEDRPRYLMGVGTPLDI
ncbi:MAG: tRNA guanosine(34) transglycosylase Tgt, partial [Armatimonadota bacterium]